MSRATFLANRIAEDIVAKRLQPSSVLGSEREMRMHYGVGVGTLREAVRILELRETGKMRRGPGGGFVVTLPTMRLVSQALTGYLCLARTTPKDLLEAHRAIGIVASTLIWRFSWGTKGWPADADLADPELRCGRPNVLRRVAARTGNAIVLMMADCVGVLSGQVVIDPAHRGLTDDGRLRCDDDCQRRMICAIESGDETVARKVLSEHEQHLDGAWQEKDLPIAPWIANSPRLHVTDKRAGQIARNIIVQIVRSRVAPGARLGAEADLCKQYRMSRSVARQVIGLLQEVDIARSQRGRSGGVYVRAPSLDIPRNIIRSFLRAHRVSIEESRVVTSLATRASTLDRASSNPVIAMFIDSLRLHSVAT